MNINPARLNKFLLGVFSILVFSVAVSMTVATTGVSTNSLAIVTTNDPTITKTFTLEGPGQLDVSTSGGGISVEGTNGNQVEIEVYIRIRNNLLAPNDPMIDEVMEVYDLIMEQNGQTITVAAKKKNGFQPGKNANFGFKIKAPVEVSNYLRTSGGGLSLSNVKGNQKLNTSGGGINLDNITGTVDAHTSGGGIKVTNQDGDIDLNTSGGGISIIKSKGNISASTSGGSITLEDNDGNIDASTSGGPIRINGNATSVRASTSGGGIRADITGLSQQLVLKTSGGSINVVLPRGLGMDLDLSGSSVNINLENFSGSAKKGKVEGSMNGGGIPVELHTSGGGVNVEFR